MKFYASPPPLTPLSPNNCFYPGVEGGGEFNLAMKDFFKSKSFLGDPVKQEVPQEETAFGHSFVRPSVMI